jgi:hypothetical protein
LLNKLLAAAFALALLPASAQASRLELGLANGPGGVAAIREAAPFGYRYQYLAAGVNTGNGWSTWNENGTFVSRYIAETPRAMTPVFTYYMIRQSLPGRDMEEAKGVLANLRNADTMRAYWADLELFFRRAGATRRAVFLHVEPDMWGYLEKAGQTALARSVAQRIVGMRNRMARNVRLGYHVSVWGTNTDIAIQDPAPREVDRLAAKSAAFYRSLRARFDVLFGEFADRDSGFLERIYGRPHKDAWWDAADFASHARYLTDVSRATKRRWMLWQIPLGNSTLDDTWQHFRDNRPEWLLGDGWRAHLQAYARAGVMALLFGGGADGTTSETTDGGWFLRHARSYYEHPVKTGS